MSLSKEDFYKRLLKKKQHFQSTAPTPSVATEREYEMPKQAEEPAIESVLSEQSIPVATVEEEKQYSPETIALGRKLHRQWLESRR